MANSAQSVAQTSANLLDKLAQLGAGELESLVRHHNAAYWDRHDPEIDDVTFDKLVETLRTVHPTSSVLNELGEKVTGGARRFAQVTHAHPMLSLDKCYDDATLQKWRKDIVGGVLVTPKIDGVACSVRYDDAGKLVLCATRGSGKVGEDITDNARQIPDIADHIPSELPREEPIEVRGEVYMRLSRFEEAYAKDYPNPRNLTAGALKQREPEKSAEYGLNFFVYDVRGTGLDKERDKMVWLEKAGFAPPPWHIVEDGEDLGEWYRKIEQERASYDYELDGVVMKADSVPLQKKLGSTAHHPRYAMAYKFQGESAQTKLVDVEWSVARSGAITPVAIVDPVFVSGVTVTRASLHHAGYIDKLGLTEDCTVELVRRGGVIPHIERVLSAQGAAREVPKQCPGGKGVTREGDFIFCAEAETCPVVLRSRVKHFNKVINLVGFGEKHLTRLQEKGLVKRPVDLFRLTKDDLVQLERLAEKSALNLLAEIERKRRLPLAVFLTALGIEEVGLTVAETIVDRFSTWEALRDATEEQLGEIHGVGPSIAESLAVALEHRRAEIEELLTEVTAVAVEPKADVDPDHPLANKAVVFTGKMAVMDRKSAQKLVKDAGGRTPSSVSKELDFLVIGDEGSPLLGDGKKSTKQKTAEKLNEGGASIEIVSESAFLRDLLGQETLLGQVTEPLESTA